MKLLDSNTAIVIKVAAIVLATLSIYNQDLTIVANEALRSELMSHILAVPFLFTYLIYRKRKMLRASIPFKSPTTKRNTIQTHEMIGALVCLLAFLLYWYGSYTFNSLEHHIVSLPLFIAGLVLAMFNLETLRVLAFPVAFLLFLMPPPLEVLNTAGTTLSIISSEVAYTVLRGIGLPVTLTFPYDNPAIELTKAGSAPLSFEVDIACAGLYSLNGFAIFSVFVAYIARGVTWRKPAIFLVGFPLIYALNITRIIVIVMIGAQSGIEVAMQAFHLLGGWVLIVIGTVILMTISKKIQLFTARSEMAPCNYCDQSRGSRQHYCSACGRVLNPVEINLSKRDLSKMAILAVASILIFNLQVPVFALTEGPSEVTIQTLGGEEATAQILPEIPEYTTRFVYRDRRFEKRAKQDASLLYAYTPANNPEETIWVTIEVAKTRASLHRIEVCLIVYMNKPATLISLRDVQILQNPPITGRYSAFQDPNSSKTQVVLYWYENAYFNVGGSLEKEHVKISLFALANKTEDVPIIEEELLPFAEAIVAYWQPITTWSQSSLFISQNGIILVTITAASLATVLTYQIIKEREEKKSNLKIYNKLVNEEKMILQATHQAAQKEKPTLNTIASHYQKITAESIGLNMLLKRLNEAAQLGVIKRDIASREDEPTLVWRSKISL